ncbi:MAG: sterol desaturase family protein [Chitinophagales bacterium]|nr:sterol desaturase family protein [Chitinophagales bacterium]MDW8394398.1 sterol desaturase family protein [Chitinophagales bacterium]
METIRIKNKGQAKLFRSRSLERLTKTSPQVIYSIYIPLILAMLAYAAFYLHAHPVRLAAFFLFGMAFWTLFEYLMHRFVFHHHSENPRVQRILYTAHGVHHEFPRDKDRLFMPPVPSLLIASVLFSLFYWVMGPNAFLFWPGFVSGYLIYGTMHYAIHAMAPPLPLFKPLWRYHHLHHYKEPDKGFGVSSPLWDHVFGTVPRTKGKFANPEERS